MSTDEYVSGVWVKVKGQVETYSPQTLPVPNPDACTNSGLTCPLKANRVVTYDAEFTVPSFLTKVSSWYDVHKNQDKCKTVRRVSITLTKL